MRKMTWLKAVVLAVLLVSPLALAAPVQAAARDIDPIVSTDWLQKNLDNSNLVVVDVRKVEEYKAGHIPGAVNIVYGTWAVKKGDLLNELPAIDDLADAIGSAGIDQNSLVVIVGKTDKVPDQFDMTRVAWTLKYLGVPNVAILNGGQNQWVKENKPVSQDMTKSKEKSFTPSVNKDLFVTRLRLRVKSARRSFSTTAPRPFLKERKSCPLFPKQAALRERSICPSASCSRRKACIKTRRRWKRWRRRRPVPI